MTERITGVALLTDDGALWSLPKPARHGKLFALAAYSGVNAEPCLQGFTTSAGRFVGRIEARKIADAMGQILAGARSHSELYSEDIW